MTCSQLMSSVQSASVYVCIRMYAHTLASFCPPALTGDHLGSEQLVSPSACCTPIDSVIAEHYCTDMLAAVC